MWKVTGTFVVIAAISALMVGCDTDIQRAVREQMKDPGSTKFGQTLKFENWACVDVNSKNSFGAYTGMRGEFLRSSYGGGWTMMNHEQSCSLDNLKEIVEREKELASRHLKAAEAIQKLGKSSDPACVKKIEEVRGQYSVSADYAHPAMRERYRNVADVMYSELLLGNCAAVDLEALAQ